MAVQTITYGDKSYLNENADIPATNKVQDTDMNEIKSVVNNNANILQGETTYSLNEINTGKIWIDGKPIYRKVINCGALPNNAIKNVAHNISNLDFVIFLNGISYSSATGNYFPLPYAADILQAQVKIWATNTDVSLQTLSDRSNYTTTYIILEYTKTS